MIKDQEYLKSKASYCLDLAKKLGATDASVTVGNSISETVNFRNKALFLKFTVSDMEFPTVTLASVAPNFFAKSRQYDALDFKYS